MQAEAPPDRPWTPGDSPKRTDTRAPRLPAPRPGRSQAPGGRRPRSPVSSSLLPWGLLLTPPRLEPGGSKGNRRGLSRGGAAPGLGVGCPPWCERPALTPAGHRPPEGGRDRPSPRRLHCLAPRRSQERFRTRPGAPRPARVERPARIRVRRQERAVEVALQFDPAGAGVDTLMEGFLPGGFAAVAGLRERRDARRDVDHLAASALSLAAQDLDTQSRRAHAHRPAERALEGSDG